MRDRIIGELGDLAHRRFLVYLMGPYRAFDVAHVLDGIEPDAIPESVDLDGLVDSKAGGPSGRRDTLDLLLELRDALRTGPGVNAFLAIDVSLDELDAASLSIAFARASNAVVYVVPAVGDNLGVGIEVGAVLEALFGIERSVDGGDHHRERVLFVHESAVTSAMIAAVRDRWEARVYSYDDRVDLDRQVRLFARDLMRKERLGALPRLD